MYTLHKYPECWGQLSLSPFCSKVEVFLKLSHIPYKVKIVNNPKKAPKRKYPVLEDAHGNIIPDSSIIMDYLFQNHALEDLKITHPKTKAHAIAFKAMIEDSLYFCMLYMRWVNPEGWEIMKTVFEEKMPLPLKKVIPPLIRSSVLKAAEMQGIGRFTLDEVYDRALPQVDAIAEYMNGKDFFAGKSVSYMDAILFPFLEGIDKTPIENHIQKRLHQHTHLKEYQGRVEQLLGMSVEEKQSA